MSWLKQSWNKRFALFLTSCKQPLKQGMVSLFALCPSPLRQRARSIQPKFRPVRPGKVVHLKRWASFFETFPVGPNRSTEFWTEISGNFGWMDRAQRPYGELQWQHGTTGIVRNLCNKFGTKNSLPRPIFVKDQLWFDFRKPSHFGWSLSGGSTAQGALATTTATATRTPKKEMGLLSKATTLPSLRDYNVKMPDFTLYGGRKQATTNCALSV